MANRRIELSLDVPSSVSNPELRQYLTEAIEAWGGSRHPDDHLCGTVSVTELKFIPKAKP
jgi:hypothetical protein